MPVWAWLCLLESHICLGVGGTRVCVPVCGCLYVFTYVPESCLHACAQDQGVCSGLTHAGRSVCMRVSTCALTSLR